MLQNAFYEAASQGLLLVTAMLFWRVTRPSSSSLLSSACFLGSKNMVHSSAAVLPCCCGGACGACSGACGACSGTCGAACDVEARGRIAAVLCFDAWCGCGSPVGVPVGERATNGIATTDVIRTGATAHAFLLLFLVQAVLLLCIAVGTPTDVQSRDVLRRFVGRRAGGGR